LEAAEEIAAQLRLRDLAGLIVIDFIDCKRETHNKAIMERLIECLRADKARMEVGKINRFGVLVMTRQRIRPSIHHVTHEACPMCQGTGQVKNSEALVLSVLRRLKSVLSRNSTTKIQVRLSPAIAMNLLNKRRHELVELETAYETAIAVSPDHGITYGEISMELTRREEGPEQKPKETHEHKRDAEDETVVLDGDAPISFNKAFTTASDTRQNGNPEKDNGHAPKKDCQHEATAKTAPQGTKKATEKTVPERSTMPAPERHQKPAPEERDRLLSIFENSGTKAGTVQGKTKGKKDSLPAPPPIEPPKLSADVIASLAVPANMPRKLLPNAEPSGAQTIGKVAKKTGTKPTPKTKNQDKPSEPPKKAKTEKPALGETKAAAKKGDSSAPKRTTQPKAAKASPKAKAVAQTSKAAKKLSEKLSSGSEKPAKPTRKSPPKK
jgi:ribonuclease E